MILVVHGVVEYDDDKVLFGATTEDGEKVTFHMQYPQAGMMLDALGDGATVEVNVGD